MSKEQFIQANFKFVVSPVHNYRDFIQNSDKSINWDVVRQVCFR